MKRRAFTLVELLVVVGVLGILAVIFWPVYPRHPHNNSRKSSCQNNLKQLALGFKQYINDNNECFPLVGITQGSSTGAPPYGWADALQPYIRSTQVYQCPSDTYEGNDDPRRIGYSDYWYNANFVRKVPQGATFKMTGAPEPMLGAVSQTVIAGDGGNSAGKPTGDARYNICGDGTSLTRSDQVCAASSTGLATFPSAQIHLEGANFAYADGHVKWLRGNNSTQSAAILSNRADYANIGHKYAFWLKNNWLLNKPSKQKRPD